MKTTFKVVTGMLCAWILLAAHTLAADSYSGNWSVMPSKEPGRVHFGLNYRRDDRHHSSHSSDWPVDAFQGVDFAERGKREVQFIITRDAGRFDCEGYLHNGVGAGVFLFSPDAGFASALAALGFRGVDEEKQYAMATVDVSLEFARQMKAEKLAGLDSDKLIALRIFNVTPQYIREMRAEGLPMTEADKVIAFRVHGVSVASVRNYRKFGIAADEHQLIAMHVHGATPEWIGKMRSLGFAGLDVNKLIAFRVHGVTPEFIDGLKARGVKDLSADQLIQLKVHGIE